MTSTEIIGGIDLCLLNLNDLMTEEKYNNDRFEIEYLRSLINKTKKELKKIDRPNYTSIEDIQKEREYWEGQYIIALSKQAQTERDYLHIIL